MYLLLVVYFQGKFHEVGLLSQKESGCVILLDIASSQKMLYKFVFTSKCIGVLLTVLPTGCSFILLFFANLIDKK